MIGTFRYANTNDYTNTNWELLQSVDLIHWTVVPPSAYTVSNPYVYVQYVSNTISHVVSAVKTNVYGNTLTVVSTNRNMNYRVRFY